MLCATQFYLRPWLTLCKEWFGVKQECVHKVRDLSRVLLPTRRTHAHPVISAREDLLRAEATHVITPTFLFPRHDQTFPFPDQDLSRGGPGPC